MIRNYFKIAFRNLAKYKFISFINLFGLTMGLTCCLLILCYIVNELSYDRFIPNNERIYRVTRTFNDPQTGAISLKLSTVAPPFGPLLANDFKQIEKTTRLLQNGPAPLRYEEKMFNEENVYWADENVIEFFNVGITEGNAVKALKDPFNIIITGKIAEKYFGKEDAMNKIIKMGTTNLKVAGIFNPFPFNTHVHPEIMISFTTLNDSNIYGSENLRTNFGNNSFFTYLLLPPHYDPKMLVAQLPAFMNRHIPGGGNFKPSQGSSLGLQKMSDIHLRSHMDYEAEENGDIKRVYIFSAIALFILLIACINYMNLSTARSTLRAREIGIRKVVGAQRKEIIAQFLSESVLISWMAMLLAFVLTILLLPGLNKLSGQTLSINVLLRWQILIPMITIPFIIGVISGIYPALFMSAFKPVMVLKGLFKTGRGNISFRQVLVTIQFAISIILIISTAIIFDQMRFMQNKALGFDKEHIINLPYDTNLDNRYESFRADLLSDANIKNAGRSSRIPTGRLLDSMGSQMYNGDSLSPVNVDIKFVSADQDFTDTYGIKIVAGRGFSRNFKTDTTAFLINEAAAKVLGFKNNEDAIGKDFGYGNRKGKLIGVFNDFHFESMHQKIVPLVLLIPRSTSQYGGISIKMSGRNIPATLEHIEKTWKAFLPEAPYQYTFLDENFERLYKSEQRQAAIFTIFAAIAIFIACLGLFGLSAFAITQRFKEIGIRKVLGASVSNIVSLLSKDFMKLVIIAAIIAFPVAWYFTNGWLQDFAYRINMPWWIYVAACIIAAAVALGTISFQAIKVAIANPVKSLRTE